MTDKEIETEVRKAIAKDSQKLTDFLFRKLHFDFRKLNAIVQKECGSVEPIKDEKRLLPEHLNPFRISMTARCRQQHRIFGPSCS